MKNFPLLLLSLLLLVSTGGCSETTVSTSSVVVPPLWEEAPHSRPSCVRGIHLTSWVTGSTKARKRFEKLFEETELNTAVIDIKEIEGDVYIPGVKMDGKPNYTRAVSDIEEYVKYLKDRGVFTIARIVVFHDNKLAKEKPEWAIHSSSSQSKAKEKGYPDGVWVDRRGSAWADPTHPEVQKYNVDVAVRAAELGFQGIQFDYIRFPSDGNTNACIYHKPHSKDKRVDFLNEFLERAEKKLRPKGVELSIDVFGLSGSYDNDLGIGQKLAKLLSHVDVISPMMYPSHYAPGEYGLKDPNNSPYETVFRSIRDTKKVLKDSKVALRPFLQDFSLGVKYDGKKVRDQIQAAADQGVLEWLLWNPLCQYTKDALDPFYQKSKTDSSESTEPSKEK